jgi:hypothetical protein
MSAGHLILIKTFFVGRSEGRKPLEKSRPEWENNIKMDHNRVGGCSLDLSDSGLGQVMLSSILCKEHSRPVIFWELFK